MSEIQFRIDELEAQNQELVEENNALRKRVGELEGLIQEFLEASYIYESENGEPTYKHKSMVQRAEALTGGGE